MGAADGASFYSIDAGRAHVAEVLRGRGQDIGLHQLRANARLIAAAPLLLDACKQAVELFEDDEGIAQVLLAAIAAAEGRA